MSGGSQSEGASNSASPASSVALSNPGSTQGINNNAPKYGTLVPNRIFVGGISSNTTEAELSQLFSKYGNVKATKIIADRAGVSKGYGFVTFESEEEVKLLIQDANNIVLKERRLNIAPAIKKQHISRSFDSSSPPPAMQNLYFHNGIPYTFHNGMAFFPPTAHPPGLAALPPSADPSMYQPYGPAPNSAPAPYGTPVLVPAPPPMFMPQNYSYQPMPMTNGAATQFIYTGSGSPNSGPGSPMSGTPDTSHMPPTAHLAPQFYPPQYATQETFFHQPVFFYSYNSGDFDAHDQQTMNDDCSSTISSPHSEISDRSSNRSPAHIPRLAHLRLARGAGNADHPRQVSDSTNKPGQTSHTPSAQSNTDSHVPVVSWQNLKNQAEERELYIRDGRRAFHPIVPRTPPPSQPQMYQQLSFPRSYQSPTAVYQQTKLKPPVTDDSSRVPRQNTRGRSRSAVSANSIPFIPKFPACFNNNNPLVMNNNFYDKNLTEPNNGGRQQRTSNVRGKGPIHYTHNSSSPFSKPEPTSDSLPSSPGPQIQQPLPPLPYDRQSPYAPMTNTVPRWNPPPITSNQIKRLVSNKRQNGTSSNLGMNSNQGGMRLSKKAQGSQESMDSDMGGGGDAQPILLSATPPSIANPELSSKMQSLTLEASS